MQVDGFVLQRAPQALVEDVVQAPPPAVHGDGDTGVFEHCGERTYSLRTADPTGIGSFEIDVVVGVVSLTADFGSNSGLGMISGTITDIEADEEELDGTLNLGPAPIGAANSGFFEGDAKEWSKG